MKELDILSKEKFGIDVMDLARKCSLDVIEAILHYCDLHGVNMDDVLPMLDKGMKEQIRVDAIRGRYVRGFKLSELDL